MTDRDQEREALEKAADVLGTCRPWTLTEADRERGNDARLAIEAALAVCEEPQTTRPVPNRVDKTPPPVERGGSYADASPRRKLAADALRGFHAEVDDPLGWLILADRVLAALDREDTDRPDDESLIEMLREENRPLTHRAADALEALAVREEPEDRKTIIAALRILQDRTIGSAEACERAIDLLVRGVSARERADATEAADHEVLR